MELIQHSITQQVSSRYRTSLTNVPQETPEPEPFVSTVPAVCCSHFCIFLSRRHGDGPLIRSVPLLQPSAFNVNWSRSKRPLGSPSCCFSGIHVEKHSSHQRVGAYLVLFLTNKPFREPPDVRMENRLSWRSVPQLEADGATKDQFSGRSRCQFCIFKP